MNILLLAIGTGIMGFAALLPYSALRLFLKFYAVIKEEEKLLEMVEILSIVVLCVCVLLGVGGFVTFCFAI